jgi:hypothetical protein
MLADCMGLSTEIGKCTHAEGLDVGMVRKSGSAIIIIIIFIHVSIRIDWVNNIVNSIQLYTLDSESEGIPGLRTLVPP